MAEQTQKPAPTGERLAKVIARAGLCSRRDAEKWIADGRVGVDGNIVITPATNVTPTQAITVDGEPLAARHGTRLWLYHKPAGLVVTEKDPEGRETIFDKLEAEGLPRVLTVGRLDINTEGLLLLTNDGGLKRVLELPSTGWLRKYRVRAFGSIDQARLDTLTKGMSVDGVNYGPIEATLERIQGGNVWLVVALREGKNREVKNVLGELGLQVNRLIRISYGPFQLGDMAIGSVSLVKAKVLRDQLGDKLAERAGVDFDSAFPEDVVETPAKPSRKPTDPNARLRGRQPRPGKKAAAPKPRTGEPRFAKQRAEGKAPPARADKRFSDDRPVATRRVLFDDGRKLVEEAPRPRRERGEGEDGANRGFGGRGRDDSRGRDGGPRRDGDRDDRQRDRGPRGSDRPMSGDRPARGDRPFGDRKPARPGSRPDTRGDQRSDGPRRDARPGGPRDGAKSSAPRGGGRSFAGGKPSGEGRPSGAGRPTGGGRPAGGGRPTGGNRPFGGGKPSGSGRPSGGSRPSGGGKPSGPRGRGPK